MTATIALLAGRVDGQVAVAARATASRKVPHSVASVARRATARVAAASAAIWVGSTSGMSCATTRPSLVATRLPRTPATWALTS